MESLIDPGSEADDRSALFRFAATLPVFAGHFPGAPIVPGVFLLEAVRLVVERRLGTVFRIVAIEEAKFTSPIDPETSVAVDVKCRRHSLGVAVAAEIFAENRAAARIELLLAERGNDEGIDVPGES